MTELTANDQAAFRRLGLATLFDLRANNEREHHPTDWHHGERIEYHCRDYQLSVGALDDLVKQGNFTADILTAAIHDAYREMPFEQAESYRRLFELLVAGRVPLLFSCTAGKDRTGIAAALILFALGVPRKTIELDYSLTERSIDKLVAILLRDPRYSWLSTVPRAEYLPILRADPEYLAIAFQEIERRHHGIPEYLERVLGVGPRQIDRLRDVLLT
jgi:protein-tyrosine phosphatase